MAKNSATKKQLKKIKRQVIKTKKNKYGVSPKSDRTWTGIWNDADMVLVFDSKFEMHRFNELLVLEKAGEIHALKLQPRFLLESGFVEYVGDKKNKIRPEYYIGDFKYITKDAQMVCEDVKGFETALFRSKWKRVKRHYSHYEFRMIKK